MNWDEIDWKNRQDIDIAEETGKTRERIRQIRRDNNYPECINKGRNREKVKFEEEVRKLIEKEKIIQTGSKLNKTIIEIAELTQRDKEYVARALPGMELKAKPANAKYNWEGVDWAAGNKEIAEEKNTSTNYVSRQRRKYGGENGTQSQST